MIFVYPDTYFFPIEENNFEGTTEFVDKDKDIVLISREAEEDDNDVSNELLEDIDNYNIREDDIEKPIDNIED